jgi:hypothetical protein
LTSKASTFLGLFRRHHVDLAVGLRDAVLLVVQGGQTDGRAAKAIRCGDRLQQGPGIAGPPSHQIVVGEREAGWHGLERVGHGLERGFRLFDPPHAQVIGHQRALRGHVLRIESDRPCEGRFGLGQPAGRPIEAGQ